MTPWGRQLLASILVNAIYEMKNYPVVLLNTVLSPLSFLLVIAFVSRGQLIGEAIEGGFIMSMFQSGMSLQGDLSHLKNDLKLQDMVVSSPTPPLVFMSGMALAELVYSIPALAVLTVLAAVYIRPDLAQTLGLVTVFLLMFLVSITLGFTLSTFSSDIVQSFAFSRLISTLFSTLPPVYYPITYIPLPFRYVAYLSPTTYAAQLSQSITRLTSVSLGEFVTAWAVLLVVTALLILASLRVARWREV